MDNRYIMRLDDACERRDIEKWNRMENLLDQYGVRPLVGVIPDCKDEMMFEYPYDKSFWDLVHTWKNKEWCIAMHGFNHVYVTESGGINPVNYISEFAGVPLDEQFGKIREGVQIFHKHGINPEVFFAPAHTFDLNTIDALKQESEIRIISDTIANDSYSKWGMTFVPQQSGSVRKLPFKTVTFCYHPNVMVESDFLVLEKFLEKYKDQFIVFPVKICARGETAYDKILQKLYMKRGIWKNGYLQISKKRNFT